MQKKGFTLLEVLIVVVILAAVVLFAAPAYKKMQARAQYNAALGTLIQLGEGIRMTYEDINLTYFPEKKVESSFFTSENMSDAENTVWSGVNSNGTSEKFLALAVSRGHMPKLHLGNTNTPFEFYMCNPEADPGDCCQDAEVIACMHIPCSRVNSVNKEFSKAYYYQDGHYKRVAGRNCSN